MSGYVGGPTSRDMQAINTLHGFLNPAKGSMDGPQYAALRAERSKQWNGFVNKLQSNANGSYTQAGRNRYN